MPTDKFLLDRLAFAGNGSGSLIISPLPSVLIFSFAGVLKRHQPGDAGAAMSRVPFPLISGLLTGLDRLNNRERLNFLDTSKIRRFRDTGIQRMSG